MKFQRIHPDGPELPRLITGVWRWEALSPAEIIRMVEVSLENGIDVFDHADIYGDHTIESNFGKALQSAGALKQKLRIITKCGIKFPSAHRPDVWVKHYDTTYDHIVWSVDNSLRNLGVEILELVLIHRPDPLFNPAEAARAFKDLKEAGKVKYFGVSNFTPTQFELFQAYLEFPLVTNQIELSLTATAPFFDGTLDVLTKHKVSAMAWSPLGGGRLVGESESLRSVAAQWGVSEGQLALAWILYHPAGIVPVFGTTKPERLVELVGSLEVKLDRQTWFSLLAQHRGFDVP